MNKRTKPLTTYYLYLFVYLMSGIGLTVHAAESRPLGFQFRVLGPAEGLGTHDVSFVTQDRLGFYWLVAGEGAYRFDGETAVWYPKSYFGINGLRGFLMIQDATGALWVTTRIKPEDLDQKPPRYFDPVTLQTYSLEEVFGDHAEFPVNVVRVYENQHAVFILDQDGQVFELKGKTVVRHFSTTGLENIREIGRVANGTFYVLADCQLYYRQPTADSWQMVPGIPTIDMFEIIDDKLLLLNYVNLTAVAMQEVGLLSIPTHQLTVRDALTNDQEVLFHRGALNSWVSRDGTKIQVHPFTSLAKQAQVIDIPYETFGGVVKGFTYVSQVGDYLWLAGNASVVVLQLNGFEHQAYLNGQLPFVAVRGISAVDTNQLLITTYVGAKHIALSDQQVTTVFPRLNSIGLGFDLKIIRDTTWVGFHGPLLYYQTGKEYTGTQNSGFIPAPYPTRIPFQDWQGNLWVGLAGGIGRLDKGSGQVDQLKEGIETIADAFINGVTPTSDEHIFWLATRKGAFLFSTEESRILDSLAVVQGRDVNYVGYDSKGRLWVVPKLGTTYLLDESLTVTDSLMLFQPSWGNHLHAMLEDEKGNFWFPTDAGLLCCDASLQHCQRFTSTNAGLPFNEFNLCAWEKLPDGRFALGGIDGLMVFDPLRVRNTQLERPTFAVRPTAVTLSTENGTQHLTFLVSPSTNDTIISLPNEFERLQIHFSYLDPLAEDISYFYRTKHAKNQGDWLPIPNGLIPLNSLPSGNNTIEFAVQTGINQYKVIGDPLYFQVAVAWYFRPGWLLVWTLLVVGSVYGIIQLRLRQIQKEKEELSLLVAERTATIEADRAIIAEQRDQLQQVNAAKDKLFGLLGHELRTPLTGVVGMGKKVSFLLQRGQLEALKKVSEQLDRYALDTENMLQNLLDWGRVMMQEDTEPLRSEFPVQEVVTIIRQQIEPLLVKKSLTLRTKGLEQDVFFDADALEIILRNLLINAIKYTPQTGELLVECTSEESHLTISVINTGSSFPAVVLQNIKQTDFFYSTRGTAGEKGSGLGLRLCHELAQQNNASLQFANQTDPPSAVVRLLVSQERVGNNVDVDNSR